MQRIRPYAVFNQSDQQTQSDISPIRISLISYEFINSKRSIWRDRFIGFSVYVLSVRYSRDCTGPSRLEVKILIAKLKKYKSPGSDRIPAELIQGGG
jgi:hypothetical protein